MSGISDSDVISALRRQMTIAAARQAASAGNLANIDTPNYKAVEVSFSETLEAQVAATHPGHLGGGGTPGVRTEEIRDAAARRDGNNVVLDGIEANRFLCSQRSRGLSRLASTLAAESAG